MASTPSGAASPRVLFFGDESGTLVDPRDVVVVVALIATTQPERLVLITQRAWRKYTERKGKRRPIQEFKFHDVETVDRQRVLRSLSQTQVDLVVLIVDKGNQQIADTPENYCLLLAEVIETGQAYFSDAEVVITLDRHFSKPAHQETVSAKLKEWLKLSDSPVYADSKTSPIVQLADFVAGAFHRKHINGDDSLAAIVAGNVIEQRIVRWKDLKRKWLTRGK